MKKIYTLSLLMASLFSVAAFGQSRPQIKMDNTGANPVPESLKFNASANIPLTRAGEMLSTWLPVDKTNDRFVLSSTTHSKQLTVQRYNQFYKGIRVAYGTYAVSAKNDIIVFMAGKFYKTDNDLATMPLLDEAAALNKALADVSADKYSWQIPAMENILKKITRNPDTSNYPKGTLVYVEDHSSGKGDGQLHLAYKFPVYAAKPLSNTEVFVDALSGKILFRNSILKDITATGASLYNGNISFETDFDGSQYFLYDDTRGGGIYTASAQNDAPFSFFDGFDIYNGSTSWSASAGVDAHWASEQIYDYWLSQQGRNSYNDMGAMLMNLVNYDVDYNNAFWNGQYMSYGDGSGIVNGGYSPMVSLDICAHELGHGICEYTCGLVYEGEPGAMNEGLSDIWGAVIENWANPNEIDAVAKNTWQMGEEVGSEPLRSMEDPKLYGNPDTYGGTYWTNTVGCNPNGSNDQCGVHNNSGIMNHWFYLLVNGGTGVNDNGHSFQVPAIGIADAASIVYNTELSLSPFSQYSNAAGISFAIAESIFGNCSLQAEAVARAWDAVGVDSSFVPCTPQVSFSSAITNVSEKSPSTACPATKVLSIPVVVNGPLPAGGTATVTVSATSTNAVDGVDYSLSNTTLSFPAGSSTTQSVTMTIFDNGAVDADKEIVLHLALAANGSNITLANIFTENKIIIINDDKAPDLGGPETWTVGTSNVVSNFSSPFFSSAKIARTQYVILAQDLVNAGVRPNVPVQSIAFKVTQKFSTVPFNGYTIKMGNTPLFEVASDWVTGLTQVYNGNYSSVLGWNTLAFTNNFTWNGTDNVAVEICFSNASFVAENDKVAGVSSGGDLTAYASSTAGTSGCTLSHFSSDLSSARPLIRFVQDIPSTPVETMVASTRSWDIRAAQDVYYYSTADGELIARLDNPSADLGCVTAEVSQQGNGFVPASFGSVNRSAKEVRITPAQAAATVTYTGTIYLKNTEIAGTGLANARIVKTDAATDAGITSSNTMVVTPTLVNGVSFTGFQADFTGFSRFFIIDNAVALSVKELKAGGNIGVVSNPFRDQIFINYTVKANTPAAIHLYDITGKLLYNASKTLPAGEHNFSIDVSGLGLAAGHYMLQIVTQGDVLNEKLLKE